MRCIQNNHLGGGTASVGLAVHPSVNAVPPCMTAQEPLQGMPHWRDETQGFFRRTTSVPTTLVTNGVVHTQVEWYQTSGIVGGGGGGAASYSAADEYAGAYYPAAAPGGADFGSFEDEPPLLEGASSVHSSELLCSGK